MDKPLSFPIRCLFVVLGTICLGLAVLGAILPVLPATPFVLGAMFCYGRGSERLSRWLLRQKFIARCVADLTTRRGLTAKTKRAIVGVAALTMTVAAVLINKPVMYIVFGILIGIKVLYFHFGIKTIPETSALAQCSDEPCVTEKE